MIDLQQKTEWQFVDEETGLLFPWLTKSCLDEIVTWDLKDKKLFEFGLGASTVYWSRKCKEVYGVESNEEYFDAVRQYFKDNDSGCFVRIEYSYSPTNYTHGVIILNAPYDIIVIDGILREECVPVALECLKPGGRLIYDNWLQPSVEVQSEETQKLLLSLPHKIYSQEGHPDWKTLIVYP